MPKSYKMISFDMLKRLYIQPHQGLGDHIISSGLYREFAKRYDLCVIPVFKNNYLSVKDLLKDLSNVQVVSHFNGLPTFELNANFLK